MAGPRKGHPVAGQTPMNCLDESSLPPTPEPSSAVLSEEPGTHPDQDGRLVREVGGQLEVYNVVTGTWRRVGEGRR